MKNLKLKQSSRLIIDRTSVQMPDGLEPLRALPILRHFIPENINPTNHFIARLTFSNCLVESSVPLQYGEKFDCVFDGAMYMGVMAVRSHSIDVYECSVDNIENIDVPI